MAPWTRRVGDCDKVVQITFLVITHSPTLPDPFSINQGLPLCNRDLSHTPKSYGTVSKVGTPSVDV